MDAKELLDKLTEIVNDRQHMNNLAHFCILELGKVDKCFQWETFFSNMTNLGIVDDDDVTQEYRNGLIDFYQTLLDEIKLVENADISFLGQCTEEFDRELFHDNMTRGVCLLSDVKCYEPKEKEIINLIGGCILRKFKHDDTIERLQKLGDTSHIFDDPIDITKRNQEQEVEAN
mgnify:CR=1 FL=1